MHRASFGVKAEFAKPKGGHGHGQGLGRGFFIIVLHPRKGEMHILEERRMSNVTVEGKGKIKIVNCVCFSYSIWLGPESRLRPTSDLSVIMPSGGDLHTLSSYQRIMWQSDTWLWMGGTLNDPSPLPGDQTDGTTDLTGA
ncbi:Hypothetical predicted protein [Prunus dulcis]|uniref:Uncharacterized protein n=1 Tax=Prunus dulcis TaxID=3755 RepID=A0A5E4G289_PRUDU|nr:Hypothetical predicted protein [Prunus dulcis]